MTKYKEHLYLIVDKSLWQVVDKCFEEILVPYICMSINEALYIIYNTLTSIDAETLDPISAKAIITILKAHKEELINSIIDIRKQRIKDPSYRATMRYFLKGIDDKEWKDTFLSKDAVRKEVDKLLNND